MLSLVYCVASGMLGGAFLLSVCLVCLSVRLHGQRCTVVEITEVEHLVQLGPTAMYEC